VRHVKEKNKKLKTGFTLTELVVSVVVLALAGGSAATIYSNYRHSLKYDQTKSIVRQSSTNFLNSLRGDIVSGAQSIPALDTVSFECAPVVDPSCPLSTDALLIAIAFPNATVPTVQRITESKVLDSESMQVITTVKWTMDGSSVLVANNEKKSDTISTVIYRT